MIVDAVTAALAGVAIMWTVLPLLRHDAWWIRIFDFPRLQIMVLTVLVIVVYAALVGVRDVMDYGLLGALMACVAFQLARIAPYTPVHGKQVKAAVDPRPEDCISLLVANVLTPNRGADELLRIVRARDPDIALFVETDDWWQSKLDVLESDYPYTIKHPLDNLYGMHLYSKLELIDPALEFLVEDDIPSVHARVMLRSRVRVDLHCVHPSPPSPTENPTSAERDAELLIVGKSVAEKNASAIVFGDLNDVAWSKTTRLFQKVSGLLDPRVGRGMYSTYHAKYPLLRWPLDHIFFSSDFTLAALAREQSFGSDHFPIYARICHTPAAKAVHEEPEADSDDRELAEEKIEKVDADEDAL